MNESPPIDAGSGPGAAARRRPMAGAHRLPALFRPRRLSAPGLGSCELPGFGWWLLGLAPLLWSVGHGFYKDDLWWLEQALRSLSDPAHVLDPWMAGFIRPLGQSFFFLEFLVFRFEPLGYNLVSLALHGVVGASIWRLARELRAPWPGAIAFLFWIGAGHLCKPVVWACSQPVLLGTWLAIAGLRRALRPDVRPWGPLLWVALATLTHDLLGLGLLGLAAVWVTQPGRRRLGLLPLPLWLGYLALSLDARTHIDQAHGLGLHLLGNGLHYLACLAGPFPSGAEVASALQATGLSVAPLVSPLVFGVGLGVALAVGLSQRGDDAARRRGALLFGLALLSPAVLPDLGRLWVDARYAYPFAALLLPLLVIGLARAQARVPIGRTRIRQGVFLVWAAGLAAGSFYMQEQALRESRSPALETRWARIEALLRGEEPE